jgi:putative glutamine amidotransferase
VPLIAVAPCGKLPDYLDSIARAGGRSRVLDYASGTAESWLADVDGLLLTGGGDVDPAIYGEVPHDTFDPAEPGRDGAELALVAAAVERSLPLLAICRGAQVLNVAAGGSLVQDIPSMVPTALRHHVATPHDALAHEISISPDSRLAGILGSRVRANGDLAVNSRHHQAVNRLAPGLRVVATAPDGVVEAIERPGPFCVGVQWHPENFWRTGGFLPLFEALVSEAYSFAKR